MATIPFPYGTDKVTDQRLPRAAYRPQFIPELYSPDARRRAEAEIRRAFTEVDKAVAQIERRLKIIEEALP